MFRLINLMFSIVLLAAPASAELSSEDRNELFHRVEEFCDDANANITRYFRFEGEAGAKGVLKLVGAELSGSVTLEQYENMEQKLGDFRTNPTICRFEAFNLLKDLFATVDPNALLEQSFKYSCNTISDPIESAALVLNGKRRKLSQTEQAQLVNEMFVLDEGKLLDGIIINENGKFYRRTASGNYKELSKGASKVSENDKNRFRKSKLFASNVMLIAYAQKDILEGLPNLDLGTKKNLDATVEFANFINFDFNVEYRALWNIKNRKEGKSALIALSRQSAFCRAI